MRILANLCSIVPGRVGGSEVYASRLLAAFASLGPGKAPDVELEVASMANTRAAHPGLADLRWHEYRWRGGRSALEDCGRVNLAGQTLSRIRCRPPFRGSRACGAARCGPIDHPRHPASGRSGKLLAAQEALPETGTSPQRTGQRLGSRAVAMGCLHGGGEARGASRPHRPSSRPSYAPETHLRADSAGQDVRPIDEPRSLAGQRFVLYPAATYPHKNHSTLIDAHAAVWARHGEPMLVLTGAAGRNHAVVTEHAARTPGVVHLGWVEEARLASLIASAVAVAFPSRYEGFGLPVLEAMAAGTPVIAAAVTALPEVVHDGGLLVDPDDLDGWIDALLEVRDGSADVARRVERGHARAEDFAPERAAASLIDAWKRAARTAGDTT